MTCCGPRYSGNVKKIFKFFPLFEASSFFAIFKILAHCVHRLSDVTQGWKVLFICIIIVTRLTNSNICVRITTDRFFFSALYYFHFQCKMLIIIIIHYLKWIHNLKFLNHLKYKNTQNWNCQKSHQTKIELKFRLER